MNLAKPTARELKAILDAHAKWTRGEKDGTRAELAGAYLARAYLTGAYLAGAEYHKKTVARLEVELAEARKELKNERAAFADQVDKKRFLGERYGALIAERDAARAETAELFKSLASLSKTTAEIQAERDAAHALAEKRGALLKEVYEEFLEAAKKYKTEVDAAIRAVLGRERAPGGVK